MALTTAQLQAMKSDILADGTLNAYPNTLDGAFSIAEIYNAQASPDFVVWAVGIPLTAVGKSIIYTAVASMTTGNQTRLQVFGQYNPVFDASDDIDAMFQDVFSGALGGGGAPSRANLSALLRKLATRVQKLFATGTGTSGSPATMTFTGSVTANDVYAARNYV